MADLRAGDLVYCSASALHVPFVEKVKAAAVSGFNGISITISDYLLARAGGMSDDELLGIVHDSGLGIAEVSSATHWLDTTSRASEEEELALHLVTMFGATGLNCTPLNSCMGSIEHASAAFGALCDRAAPMGVRCHIEYLPWTELGDLSTALTIVEHAGRSNGGLMIDTWHHFRAGGTSNDLADLPAELVFAVQLADAPAIPQITDLRNETRHRLLPGEGDADTAGCLRALERTGARLPVGAEPVNPKWDRIPPVEGAREIYRSTQSVIRAAVHQSAT